MSLGSRQALLAEFDAFADELGQRLVPAGTTAAMAEAARMFGAARPEFAFEVHVGGPTPRVDLTVRVKREARDRLAAAALTQPARRLVEAWSDPSGALAALPFVEFEFDLPEHASTPWVGPAVEPSLRQGPRVIQRERDLRAERGEPTPTLPLDALDLLGEQPIAAATRARLGQALDSLPRWGLIGQVARLDGRPSDPREGVRLFASMPRADLRPYLDGLEWPGSWARLDADIEAITPRADWVDLDFGIGQGQLEIALGCYVEFRAPRGVTSALRWALEVFDARRRSASVTIDTLETSEAIAAWLERVEGRRDRVLTIKHVLGGRVERPPKVYFSLLR